MSTYDIYERTFEFGCRIVRLHRAATRRRGLLKPFNQLFNCSTSIGANLEEAKGAQSRADFIAKVRIALKEARESHFWLRLIVRSELMKPQLVQPLVDEANEIVAILTAIVIKAARTKSKATS